MISIEEYNQAKIEIEKLSNEKKALDEKDHKSRHEINREYNEKKISLENEYQKKFSEIQINHEKKVNVIIEKIKPYYSIISDYNKIMLFMEINKSERNTDDFLVYEFARDSCPLTEIPYTPIDTIKDDRYAKIQAFIVKNKKPKNCFSLIIAGKTIFNEKIIYSPHTYNCDCHTNFTNILVIISDKPTENELRNYYKKRKNIFLEEYLNNHKKIEKEYDEIIEKTSNKKWEILYWKYKEDYYRNHYNRGTETKEYQDVLEHLKELEG